MRGRFWSTRIRLDLECDASQVADWMFSESRFEEFWADLVKKANREVPVTRSETGGVKTWEAQDISGPRMSNILRVVTQPIQRAEGLWVRQREQTNIFLGPRRRRQSIIRREALKVYGDEARTGLDYSLSVKTEGHGLNDLLPPIDLLVNDRRVFRARAQRCEGELRTRRSKPAPRKD